MHHWSHINKVKFALYCAKRMQHCFRGNEQYKNEIAIKAVEAWLLDPDNPKNMKTCAKAAEASATFLSWAAMAVVSNSTHHPCATSRAVYFASSALKISPSTLLSDYLMEMIALED